MQLKLSKKKPDGKWWTYIWIKPNKFGNLSASAKTSEMEELVNLAKEKGEAYINWSVFDENSGKRPERHKSDMNDEIPF